MLAPSPKSYSSFQCTAIRCMLASNIEQFDILVPCLCKDTTDLEYQRCWRKVKRRWFRKKVKTVCEKLTKSLSSSQGE